MSDSSEGEEEEEQNTIGEYVGDRNEAKQRHGYGVAHLPIGDIYKGFYHEGKRQGKGHYRFKKNHCRYTGEWTEGKKHGRGIFVYPDGTRYEGSWEDDMKSGQGTYYFANGNKYVGEWKEDMRQGLGICFYPATNCKYVGSWENDRRHGNGALVHQDHRYEGEWKDDLPCGPGCYIFGDDLVQEGVYILRQQDLDEEDMPPPMEEEEEFHPNMVPIWRVERVLAGEAAKSRIQRGLIELNRVASHVSIGSAILQPDKPPPAAAQLPDGAEPGADGDAAGSAVEGEQGEEGEAGEEGEETSVRDPEADQVGGDEAALGAAGAGEMPQDYTMEMRDGDVAEGSEAETEAQEEAEEAAAEAEEGVAEEGEEEA